MPPGAMSRSAAERRLSFRSHDPPAPGPTVGVPRFDAPSPSMTLVHARVPLIILSCLAAGPLTHASGTLPPLPEPFRFRLGDISCTVLFDSEVGYEAADFFVNAPPAELAVALADCGEGDGMIHTPYAGLLLRTASNTVLIDTGSGPSHDPARGRLMESLAAAGVSPDSIDTVILTHAHLDHIGGTLRADGGLAYPRARFVMARAEWEFWAAEHPDLSRVRISEAMRQRFIEIAHEKLRPLSGRIQLVDTDGPIVPGIHARLAAGHTPGHLVVEVESQGDRLVYVSDLVLSPLALEHPEWYARYDMDIAATEATKRRELARAADGSALVYAMHFPWPGLGKLEARGAAWRWLPLPASAQVQVPGLPDAAMLGL